LVRRRSHTPYNTHRTPRFCTVNDVTIPETGKAASRQNWLQQGKVMLYRFGAKIVALAIRQ